MKIKITPQLEYTLSDEDIYSILSQGSLKDFITKAFEQWLKTTIIGLMSLNDTAVPYSEVVRCGNSLYRKKRIDYGYGECRYDHSDLNLKLSENAMETLKRFEALLEVI